jgi:hypothetical protein
MNEEIDISKIYEVNVKGCKMYAARNIIEVEARRQCAQNDMCEKETDHYLKRLFSELPSFSFFEKVKDLKNERFYMYKGARGKKCLFERTSCGRAFSKA